MRNDRQIARRYAKAFVSDNIDPAAFEALAEEIGGFAHAFESDVHIKDFFLNPLYAKKMKTTVLRAVIDKLGFSDLSYSLLEILVKKERFGILGTLAEEMRDYADQFNDRVRVHVTTAVEPSKQELKVISDGLKAFFKKDTVVHRDIDPAIIGGFIIEGEDTKIDMSVAGQIRRILTRV